MAPWPGKSFMKVNNRISCYLTSMLKSRSSALQSQKPPLSALKLANQDTQAQNKKYIVPFMSTWRLQTEAGVLGIPSKGH
eukprot:scaffold359395_cov13-Prasinocladus_malaysianus.AAC.1